MDYPYVEYADQVIRRYGLKRKTNDEFGDKPCPNCGDGTDRFYINNYNGLLKHHCRKGCDDLERLKAMQRDGALPEATYSAEVVPYHQQKKIPLLEARLEGNVVVVPLFDVLTGQHRGKQEIYPNGRKKFSKGMKKLNAGCFIGDETDILYVCEGYATAVTVHLSTGQQALFALDAKTLPKTVSQLEHPQIVIAADHDDEGIASAKATGKPYALPPNNGDDWWDVYNQQGKPKVKEELKASELAESNADKTYASAKVNWIRLSDWAGRPLKEREWTVDGWIPKGQVTLLYADGGVGKSQIILQLLTSVSLGENWFGLNTSCGSALYLGAEDDTDELHRRFHDVINASFKSYEDYSDVIFSSLAGEDALLADFDPKSRRLSPSAIMRELTAAIVEHKPTICVIDTLADVFPADENDRALARQFIGMLRKPAIEHKCALVVLAHPSLSGISTGRGTSGSTGWNNSVRSRITMERDEQNPDRRILKLAKSNYSKIGTEISISWENGVFVHDPNSSGLDAQAASSKARRVFLSLLESQNENGESVNANGGSTHAPKFFAEHKMSEGVTKKAFGVAMKSLLAEGVIKSEKTQRGTRLVVIKR